MFETESIFTLRSQLREWRLAQQRLAFVPTMGNLHAGHLRLVEAARGKADKVVVSIFVNPLQFGVGEDFANYPRTLDDDRQSLKAMGVDLLFVPTEVELYPVGQESTTRVQVPDLGDILCGATRPGHFEGVATVVAKLFNLVQPDIALFGKKDYQQLMVIRRMVSELNFPIKIVAMDTVREQDGLAMSSRNRYLTAEQRNQAPLLNQVLRHIADKLRSGSRDFMSLQTAAIEQLNSAGFRADYVEIRRCRDLQLPRPEDRELVVLAAAQLGSARLIDNVEIQAE
ncbi:MAG: pantoate--beta-alanine ligase [Gammaproteobacteria bacterium]|nr:pantoate--beta-alanine ligase [Gammaproteobacteria bacterium]